MTGSDDMNQNNGFPDDIDGLAAEYVLGTLDSHERANVDKRCRNEPQLRAAIDLWQQRLAPLASIVPEIPPPSHIWPQIEKRIGGSGLSARQLTNVVVLNRRVNFWRSAALVATAVAASLAVIIGTSVMAPKPSSKPLVAILQKDATSPAFLVTVDVDNRQMTVRPVSAPPTPGKNYELWLVHDALGGPKSLGVLSEQVSVKPPTLASYKTEIIETATYAVSLEPEGGSATGLPTGPVIFSGKLLQSGL